MSEPDNANPVIEAFHISSLPNGKILDLSKFKALADNKINVNEQLKFALGKVENTAGKGENAGYRHFLLLSRMFSKGFFSRVVKSLN